MVISYETPSFRRRFKLDSDEKILESRSYRRDLERGQVYFGRVLEKVKDLGFIVDLGSFKGLCQEDLLQCQESLFEIVKYQEGKYPLITKNPGFVGQSIILREGENSYSKDLPKSYIELLKGLELTGVYFRNQARNLPLRRVSEEYTHLVGLRDSSYRELGLVYEPPFTKEGDSFYFRELESRIVHLSKGLLDKDDLRIYFEMTRAGLVIDVNGLGSPEDINKRAWPLIEEALLLMNVGGLVMVDLVGQGQGYKGPGSLTKEGVLVRTYPQRGTNLFSVDRSLLEEDYKELIKKLDEEIE